MAQSPQSLDSMSKGDGAATIGSISGGKTSIHLSLGVDHAVPTWLCNGTTFKRHIFCAIVNMADFVINGRAEVGGHVSAR